MERKWYQNVQSVSITWSEGLGKASPKKKEPVRQAAFMTREGSVPIRSGALMGRGFDTFNNSVRGDALAETTANDLGGGQTTEFSIRTITSNSELNDALGVGVQASFSGWGISVDAKADWARSRSVNSYNVYLLVKVKVINSPSNIARMELSESAQAVLGSESDVKSFFTKYGDAFVASLETGGEFFALYEFHTTSEQEKEALMVKASASGGMWSGSAEFQKKMQSLSMSTESSLKLFIAGGRGKLPEPKPENLIQTALAFPEAVDSKEGDPVVYGMSLIDYQAVKGFPGRTANLSKSHRTYQELALLRDRLITVLADHEFAQENRTRFLAKGSAPVAKVKTLEKQIRNLVDQVREDPMTLIEIPASIEEEIEKLEAGVPERAKVNYGVLNGKDDGQLFDDGRDRQVLLSRKIHTITIHSGAIWDGYSFTYTTKHGAYTPGTRGGEGGSQRSFTLGEEEYLKQITGEWGVNGWVSRVTFETNLRTLDGLFGNHNGGKKFKITAPEDSMIIGLKGYARTEDSGLAGIGAIAAVFAKRSTSTPKQTAEAVAAEKDAVAV
jgi:hypothetical protein